MIVADLIAAALANPEFSPDLLRLAQFEASRDLVRICTACNLSESRINAVPWEGFAAPVFLLGEAPGAEEDQSGRPFVGRSGRLLESLCAKAGLRRSTSPRTLAVPYSIGNVIGCRPPGNDFARAEAAGAVGECRVHRERALDLSGAWLVVCVGGKALRYHTGRTALGESLGQWWWDRHGRLTTAIYHPAYLLRQNDKALNESTVRILRRVACAASVGDHIPAPTVYGQALVSLTADQSKFFEKRGWVLAHSALLGEQIVVAKTAAIRVPDKLAGLGRYTPTELAKLRGDPEWVKRVHAAKVALGAEVLV